MAVVAGFKDRLVDFDAHLEPLECLLLWRRPGGRPRPGMPAARDARTRLTSWAGVKPAGIAVRIESLHRRDRLTSSVTALQRTWQSSDGVPDGNRGVA